MLGEKEREGWEMESEREGELLIERGNDRGDIETERLEGKEREIPKRER